MSHTPGPWQTGIRLGDDWESVVCLPDRIHEICQCFHRDRSLSGKEECEANARLIAAAPELLAALKMAKRFVHSFLGDFSEEEKQIAAAIKKAEGA